MPPVFLWALGAAGSALIARWAVKEARRVNEELDAMRAGETVDAVQREAIPTLRRDPRTGTYRLR